MIAGHAAMRDQLDVDPNPAWHLVDVATWPLVALCGRPAPEPMQRDVKAARYVAVDDACGRCLSVAARGRAVERRSITRGPTVAPGAIA